MSGLAIWLTGLSGAGKSTIAQALAREFRSRGRHVEILDGDVVRTHLSKGLGFSREDRDLNVARIAFAASLVVRSGGIAIVAAISPYAQARAEARRAIGSYVEVYVQCSLDELQRRDVKGLYAKAIRGEIEHFTGVSDPYEAPLSPEVVAATAHETLEQSVGKILTYLKGRGIDAHGGTLLQRLAGAEEGAELRARASELPQVLAAPRTLNDLHLIGNGALSPLDGFMSRADYESVVGEMRLASGLAWTLPVTLDVPLSDRPRDGARVALVDAAGTLRGVLDVAESFERDKNREARLVYGTEDAAHPGVAALYAQDEVLLGGRVTVLPHDWGFANELTPRETRAEFARLGWQTIVGFQTRNPIHRAHEYIQKCALEIVDGLLLHPLVGETKRDDVPVEVRLRCYEALLQSYYPAERYVFSVLPAAMRYAGPREAIWHAIIRKNYGCTHFIVGRDHAGVGSYYGSYDAQRLFSHFTPSELGIVPLNFENSFYCRECEGMASAKTCPHGPAHRVELSGSSVRELLRSGKRPPAEFSRYEVADVLLDAFVEQGLAS
jgi:sulfate adenylyltransferase/3'-phosphoadenosine 5'-phosphosulfate synthase